MAMFVVVVIDVRIQQSRERRHMVRSSGLRAWLCVQISEREFSWMNVIDRVTFSWADR